MVYLYRGKSVAVVMPAYNERQMVLKAIDAVPDYVDLVFVVDDGSSDDTDKLLVGKRSGRIQVVRHEHNKGVGAAIATGYSLSIDAGIDVVAVMAGDGQMDPEHLPGLLDPVIDNRADYSKGNRLADRRLRTAMPKFRTFGNFVLSVMTKAASGYWRISDSQNGYTAISREALQSLDLNQVYPYYGYCNDILIKLGTNGKRVVDVPMPARYGAEKSKIRYARYIAKVGPMIVRGGVLRYKKLLLS